MSGYSSTESMFLWSEDRKAKYTLPVINVPYIIIVKMSFYLQVDHREVSGVRVQQYLGRNTSGSSPNETKRKKHSKILV